MLVAQVTGAGDKSLHSAGGQARQGVVAERPAFIFSGPWRTRSRLQRRRLIHQNQAWSRSREQPLIGPRRGVSRQWLSPGVGKASTREEGASRLFPIRDQSTAPPRRRAAPA